MAWLAIDKDGIEVIHAQKPVRREKYWDNLVYSFVIVPKGFSKKLLGKQLTWEDEPVELK